LIPYKHQVTNIQNYGCVLIPVDAAVNASTLMMIKHFNCAYKVDHKKLMTHGFTYLHPHQLSHGTDNPVTFVKVTNQYTVERFLLTHV